MRRLSRSAWAVLALVATTAVLAVVITLWPSQPPTAVEQAHAISAELRCPDCAGLSAADSPTQAAAEIRRQVEEQLVAGRSAAEIREAIEFHLEGMREDGLPVPVPQSKVDYVEVSA